VFRHKSEVLSGHCSDLGRDFGEIVRSANYNVVIGAEQAEVDARLAAIEERFAQVLGADGAKNRVEELRTGPLVGTPERSSPR